MPRTSWHERDYPTRRKCVLLAYSNVQDILRYPENFRSSVQIHSSQTGTGSMFLRPNIPKYVHIFDSFPPEWVFKYRARVFTRMVRPKTDVKSFLPLIAASLIFFPCHNSCAQPGLFLAREPEISAPMTEKAKKQRDMDVPGCYQIRSLRLANLYSMPWLCAN